MNGFEFCVSSKPRKHNIHSMPPPPVVPSSPPAQLRSAAQPPLQTAAAARDAAPPGGAAVHRAAHGATWCPGAGWELNVDLEIENDAGGDMAHEVGV